MQLTLLKTDDIPWVEKHNLQDRYKEVKCELIELLNKTENDFLSQSYDVKKILKNVKRLEKRTGCIKKRHCTLKKHFEHHRKSLLYYVYRFFSFGHRK